MNGNEAKSIERHERVQQAWEIGWERQAGSAEGLLTSNGQALGAGAALRWWRVAGQWWAAGDRRAGAVALPLRRRRGCVVFSVPGSRAGWLVVAHACGLVVLVAAHLQKEGDTRAGGAGRRGAGERRQAGRAGLRQASAAQRALRINAATRRHSGGVADDRCRITRSHACHTGRAGEVAELTSLRRMCLGSGAAKVLGGWLWRSSACMASRLPGAALKLNWNFMVREGEVVGGKGAGPGAGARREVGKRDGRQWRAGRAEAVGPWGREECSSWRSHRAFEGSCARWISNRVQILLCASVKAASAPAGCPCPPGP